MSIPTQGETYSRILEHLQLLQEETAMMAHLLQANDSTKLALSWLAVSENFKKMQYQLTQLAMGRMN